MPSAADDATELLARIVTANGGEPRPGQIALTRAVANLAGSGDRPDPPIGPVYVAERRGLDAVHRDLATVPKAVTEPLTANERRARAGLVARQLTLR